MENSQDAYLIEVFQSCCEQYFIEKFQQNRFLYFDVIPHNYFGTDYKVEITHTKFDWLDNSILNYDIYLGKDHYHGKRRCTFEQECSVSYIVRINSLIDLNKQNKIIKFHAESFEPFGLHIFPTLIAEDLIQLGNLREIKRKIKNDFKIQYIDEVTYDNNSIGFGFFTDILRKERLAKSKDSEISHGYFYWEIAACHREIEISLLSALLNQKYSSDLLNGKHIVDGNEFYLPQFSYNDFQYLTMIGFGFDRLYSFWDRITYLLANYEDLDINFKELSFDRYFKQIDVRVQNGKQMIFDKNSKHLKWLIEFRRNQFSKVRNYRHRIVHYQMTPKWEGTLTSKFSNNATEHIANFDELKKLKLEFEGLGHLLLEQFNFCKQGFIEALYLIDELN